MAKSRSLALSVSQLKQEEAFAMPMVVLYCISNYWLILPSIVVGHSAAAVNCPSNSRSVAVPPILLVLQNPIPVYKMTTTTFCFLYHFSSAKSWKLLFAVEVYYFSNRGVVTALKF